MHYYSEAWLLLSKPDKTEIVVLLYAVTWQLLHRLDFFFPNFQA